MNFVCVFTALFLSCYSDWDVLEWNYRWTNCDFLKVNCNRVWSAFHKVSQSMRLLYLQSLVVCHVSCELDPLPSLCSSPKVNGTEADYEYEEITLERVRTGHTKHRATSDTRDFSKSQSAQAPLMLYILKQVWLLTLFTHQPVVTLVVYYPCQT